MTLRLLLSLLLIFQPIMSAQASYHQHTASKSNPVWQSSLNKGYDHETVRHTILTGEGTLIAHAVTGCAVGAVGTGNCGVGAAGQLAGEISALLYSGGMSQAEIAQQTQDWQDSRHWCLSHR